MRLGDMQAKPHQRITKYPLLLRSILQSTQDSQVQQTLRGMVKKNTQKLEVSVSLSLFGSQCADPLQLSSVNSFLESINDYLRLKDEELALSISAQRVGGYEVEGINEEIDKVSLFLFLKAANGVRTPRGARGHFCLGFCVLLSFIITLQFVREICQFDLTSPIQGVGPGVVRKLLLEESLKIRGRKDSKVGTTQISALKTSNIFLFFV